MSLSRALFAGIVLGCALTVAGANAAPAGDHGAGAPGPDIVSARSPLRDSPMPVITTSPATTTSELPAILPRPESAPRVTLLPSPSLPYVDHVVVRKAQRRLYLMDGDKVVRSYKVALGLEPVGPKERDGDFRTPEGWYRLARRNPRSEFFLSIQISYPDTADMQRAHLHGWQPGGSIMIHGLPNHLKNSPWYYRHNDWTDGCIAVSDADMVEIWLLTRDGMPIDIRP